MVGNWASVTVTVNEQVAVLLAASLTVYVTVVVPTLNVCVPRLLIPVAAEDPVVAADMANVRSATPLLSAVTGQAGVIDAVQSPAAVLAVRFAGHVMVGYWASV